MPAELTSLASPSQRERLWQIDFLARFRGLLTRQDLAQRFDIALSNATRDFTLYRELAPDNLEYDSRNKVYRRSASYMPLFSYDREHTLQALTLGQGKGFSSCEQTVVVEAAHALNQPDLDILSTVSRAIYAGLTLNITYVSANSGESLRTIVPHTLVNTGLRWHVRAYCRQYSEFRDFVLTRVTSAEIIKGAINRTRESMEQDNEWNSQLILKLIPHPNATHRRAIELDYSLGSGETLQIQARAATAGYLLRRWGVDCSPNANLPPHEYQLYLSNRSELGNISNLAIAPGYTRESGQ